MENKMQSDTDRKKFIMLKAGEVPEGATHYDPNYPEFLKLVDGVWYYWTTEGGTCVGFKSHWILEAISNTQDYFTKSYIDLESLK